ncbi:3-hydroxyacyl-CoA dehydrogenase family protein [Salinisphaera sp.]|uniref:3-hydroxyacyl-CoA dehydrogenase family protein n=1 Tax=Salinisphaera sp. TaxID=1914330 RepID=UPI002D786305|nr:3-hydroxyacyl-CoA dehydrogenase family protein [Salinisphaera sp.]HET7315042.1 3-hydroxyacyl-CoA dehydrogenase family protein [Salinisphaera sp.]
MAEASMDRPDSVGVVGTGLMGSGIAAVICAADKPVKIFDLDERKMADAWPVIRSIVDQLVEYRLARAGKSTDQLLERVTAASDYRDFQDCHTVIEAVVEDEAVKRQVYKALESCLADDAVITSNTSNIVPSALIGGMRRPERFVVTHFWNPPHSVPLVEIVPHAATAQWCIDQAVRLINEIGNDPVVLQKEAAGFIGNRLQYALLREALGIVQQGIATPAEIDRVMTASLGRRYATVGPFATADLGGLDTFLAISQQLMPQLVADNTPLGLLQDIVACGDYGAKSGRGFLDWPKERRTEIQQLRDTDLLNRRRGDSKPG